MTLHEVEAPTLAASSPRALGAFTTPAAASRFLARWTLRGEVHRVLEPSMGDGAFLDALAVEAADRGTQPTVWGVEVAADTYAATVGRGAISPVLGVRDDFLRVTPFPVDAVIANPPYVRLRHLKPHDRNHAVKVGSGVLGEPMATDASLWLPFVLHASKFLVPGGRMAFVLPFDVTYLRYARPLWRHLGRHFGSLTLVRVRERMFPELLQEVVLLLADEHGGHTDHVELRAHHHVADLDHHRPEVLAPVPLHEVVDGGRPFLEALLSAEARELLHGRVEERTVPAREVVRFNPGYVCGDKAFFHPTAELVRRHRLPERSLVPTLTSSRYLRGTGLWTSDAPPSARSSLFLPPAEAHLLTRGEQTYVSRGVHEGAARRYKCRIREPWYVTPGVKVPDVLLPVFSEAPSLLVNDAQLAASNSLLCGYLRGITAEHLATAWYTSLTLLQLELQVHSLGGGVLVVVPGEAGNLRLPRVAHATPGHLDRVSTLLAARRALDAFRLGDKPVLHDQLGLSRQQVEVLRQSVAELASWRTAYRSDGGGTSAA
jgi:adenine-specific DNA-methyltransferase